MHISGQILWVKSSDTHHYEQDVPFEVPAGWELIALEEIFILNPKNEVDDETLAGFIPMALVDDGFCGSHSFEQELWKNIKKGFSHFQNGDIGIAKISPCFENMKSVIFNNLPNGLGAGTTELTILRGRLINVKFYLYLFKTSWYISQGTKYFKGVVGQQRVNKAIFTTLEVPLPPLAEQHRIVAQIERWFTLVDIIEQGKEDLETSIKQVKIKILDLAIHGKLVPQDPNDKSALELLKRINPKAQITCDNGHNRKLPYNWCCVSHNSVIELSGGSQPPKSRFRTEYTDGYMRLFQIRDYGKSPLPVYIPIKDAVKQTHKGDILLARYGGSLGKVFLAEEGAYNVAMTKVIFKQLQLIDKMFAFYYYHSRVYQDKLKEISRTAQAGFNSGDFEDLYFPLPPLMEQKRIVKKIEELFAILDTIEQSLQA